MPSTASKSLSRTGELQEFLGFIRSRNDRWALLVGRVLLIFAALLSALTLTGVFADNPFLYVVETCVLIPAVGLLYFGRRPGYSVWGAVGGALVRLAALGWMFIVLWFTPAGDSGLTTFIIGELALALFTLFALAPSIVVYGALWLAYLGVLGWNGGLTFDPAINSALVSILAGVWSRVAWHGRVVEFRNGQLIEELKRKSLHLSTLALQDGLTGIPNRRYYDQVMEQTWADPTLADTPVALLLGDIDHFKAWNDRYGHPQGDALLKSVAKNLGQNLRSGGFVARLGGEEFSVLVMGIDESAALAAAERLRQCVQPLQVTMSWGVAVHTPGHSTPQSLYESADKALYRAKMTGRNRVEKEIS